MTKEPEPRPNGRPHLSECLAVAAYEQDWPNKADYACTCEDWFPEGDSG